MTDMERQENEVALTVFAPVKGEVLVKLEGSEDAVVVASFKYDIPIKIVMPEGSIYNNSQVRGY